MSKALVRVLIGLLAIILLLVGFVMVVATTPWGQQLVTKEVNAYLAGKLKSPFRIGRIRYGIPDYIELEDVFFKTPQGDTLLRGGRMRVDLDMWGLLNNRVSLNQIDLEHVRLNVNRTLPDTAYNFQYILDAFIPPGDTTKPKTAVDTSAAPLDINLTAIFLKDVRIKYKDDVVGADVNAYVDSLRANFRKTDVSKSQYRLANVAVDGLDAYTRLYQGIPTPTTPSKPGDTLDIGLGTWKLNRAKWDIRVETADFRTQGHVDKMAMEPSYFYLNSEKIGLKSLDMSNADIAAVLTKPGAVAKISGPVGQLARKPATSPKPDKSTASNASSAVAGASLPTGPAKGWQASLGRVRFANNRVRFDDETAPRQKRGLDYSHLDLRELGIEGNNLTYQDLGKRGERVTGQIRKGQFKATSGFTIQQVDGTILYDDKTTRLTKLYIKTPTSVIRDQVVLHYDSLRQLSNPRFAKRVGVQANLKQSRLSVADILQLAPFLSDMPLFADKGAVFRADAEVLGTLASLTLPRLSVDMLSGTHLRMSGRLTNVTDPNRIGVDLNIRDATTRLADINKFVPKGTIPSSIALPPSLDLTGKIKGQLNNLAIDANLISEWGKAKFNGTLAGFVAGKNQTYKGTLNLDRFDAGKWLKQEGTVGKLTGRAAVDGRGTDVNTLTTRFDLNVQSAELNGYPYQNFNGQGNLANGTLALTGTLNDPNANLTFDTKAGLKGASPSITGQAVVQELNLQKLKLYSDPLTLKGNIILNMPSTDPARPIGTVSASKAVVSMNGKNYPVDTLYAQFSADGPTKNVVAQLPGARLALNGQFQYAQLYDIVAGEISKYIAIPALTYKKVPPPYAVTVNLRAYQNPIFQAFVPGLTRLDTVRLNAYLDNTRDTSLSATLRTGTIVYDTTTIQGAALTMRAADNQLNIDGRINGILYNSLRIRETNLTGVAANNRFRFSAVNKDSIGQDLHGLVGTLSIVDKNYRFQFAPNGLLTNYQRWSADTAGFAQYGRDGVLVNSIRLEQANQLLEVSSTEPYGNAPIRVTTRGIQLANLARLADQDTTLAAGELNGTVVVRDYLAQDSQLSFIGSVYVDSLRVMSQPIGNLTARFRNNSDGRINVNTVLTGPYNDASVVGFYNPQNAKQALDLTIDLTRLDARTIQAFSFGELRQAEGKLTGAFTVNGTAANPQLNGNMAFDSVAFNVKQLNATYRIDQEKLNFAGQTITLADFNVRDTLGRTLTTDGTIVLKNLPDAAYNLRVRAANFQVLNASRKDNNYGYGQASVTADLRIKGVGSSPSINGTVRLEDGSKVAVVLPDESLNVDESNGIVTFINHNDSLALRKYIYRPKRDSVRTRLAFDQLSNANISLDLEADEKSELTIVVDELNGDYLRARGNAHLNTTVNAAGEISVLGRYEVTEGEYSMTYQVLKRQFEIQKGGYINFSGDPLKADLNIAAVYKVSVTPGDLIGSESTSSDATATKRKLPFNVTLSMSDNLSSPKLDFDIKLAGVGEGSAAASSPLVTTIDNKLTTLRQDQSQMNKQVFALLILNRFLPENTSDFFSGSNNGGLDTQAEGIARSSVSKLISEQLGRLASGILKGFDVDFNLLSQTGATNTGGSTNGARTDLNVGLSRSFLEGRITVSVGRNFVLENAAQSATRNTNEVFDNLSVNYALTRDGRYVLRAYRNNDYQAVLDGYVIETGVGFIITVDYNTLSEMFRRSSVMPDPIGTTAVK